MRACVGGASFVALLLPCILVAAASTVAADGATLVLQRLDGPRCYIYNHNSQVQFWIESNGVITGGEEHAIDFVLAQAGAQGVVGGTGLQRNGFVFGDGDDGHAHADHVPGDNVAPDTRLPPEAWADHCLQEPTV